MTVPAAMVSPQANRHWESKYADRVMDRMRDTCDPLADAVAARIQRARPAQMLDEVFARAKHEGGVFLRLSGPLSHHTVLGGLAAGGACRRVNLGFANVRSIALLVSSLVEGYSLSKATHVLIATGRLHQDVLRRVYETSQMTHNMNVPGGLRPGAEGHRTVMEVRLLHAMVRKYLRERGWETEKYDAPINQEDMAFTIIEFNYLALRGMERMGAALSDDDRAASHHLWRFMARQNGVCDEMLTDSLDEEIYQYQRIRERQYNPNEEGRLLAQTVITALAGQPPFRLSEGLLFELSRICLGDELADVYALPRSAFWHRAVLAYKAANRLSTLAHYQVPGVARLSEKMNLRMLRGALHKNLPADPQKRAFRHIS
ncbi:oxygenase MpaB family protein [Alcanivorax sp.]|uniref:oxygenase MpaB family protein n=1 Tax=Alcanivorax sp. TaxID=1872427 RepID=UPI003BAC87A8